MATFAELDEYLRREVSVNFWDEYGNEPAMQMLAELEPAGWEALRANWQSRSSGWQQRCASILDIADLGHAVPLLLEMVCSPDDEVAQQAADSLNTERVRAAGATAEPRVLQRLQTLAAKRPGIDAETIKALLQHLQVKA